MAAANAASCGRTERPCVFDSLELERVRAWTPTTAAILLRRKAATSHDSSIPGLLAPAFSVLNGSVSLLDIQPRERDSSIRRYLSTKKTGKTQSQNSFLNDLHRRAMCFSDKISKTRTLHVIQTLISRTYKQHTESSMKITTRKAVHVWFVCFIVWRIQGAHLIKLSCERCAPVGSALSDCIGYM